MGHLPILEEGQRRDHVPMPRVAKLIGSHSFRDPKSVLPQLYIVFIYIVWVLFI